MDNSNTGRNDIPEEMKALNIPRKCLFCGEGTLYTRRDVALIGLDTITNEVLIKPPETEGKPPEIGATPAHMLICDRCGFIVLLSSVILPIIRELNMS